MTVPCPCYSLLLIFFLFSGFIPTDISAQTRTDESLSLEIMDPETIYSFRGLDGKGFLSRKPINLPEPVYQGNETGIVPLLFSITPEGLVAGVREETSALQLANSRMISAAKTAVSQWKFKPLDKKKYQPNQLVRVVIQYNVPGSNILFSEDGLCTIEGLNNRMPVRLVPPQRDLHIHGSVSATLLIAPSGEVKTVYNFTGSRPTQRIAPRLGIKANHALMQWRFKPLPADLPQEDQEVIVTFRFPAP